MPREPRVTRTITTTTATVLCVDVEKQVSFSKDVKIARAFKDEKTILKKAAKILDDDHIRPVAVTNLIIEDHLYGMSEQDFIESATILPPRNIEIKNN